MSEESKSFRTRAQAHEPQMRAIDDGILIPRLRADVPYVEEYDRATCYTAGYLTTTNAGWRMERPVIDTERCTGCLRCYLYCPDGTIRRTHAEKGSGEAPVAVDLDWCKGCGICARTCKHDAIAMVSESAFEAGTDTKAGAEPDAKPQREASR